MKVKDLIDVFGDGFVEIYVPTLGRTFTDDKNLDYNDSELVYVLDLTFFYDYEVDTLYSFQTDDRLNTVFSIHIKNE